MHSETLPTVSIKDSDFLPAPSKTLQAPLEALHAASVDPFLFDNQTNVRFNNKETS